MPGVIDAERSGGYRHGAFRGDHPNLPQGSQRIVGLRRAQRVDRGAASGQGIQATRTVGWPADRLAHDHADARPRPRDQRPDSEHAGLDGYTRLAGQIISRDDRIRHGLTSRSSRHHPTRRPLARPRRIVRSRAGPEVRPR